MLKIKKALSVDDVQIVPKPGRLSSRQDAVLYPFIFSAPMDTVTGYELAESMTMQGHGAVLSRQLPADEKAKAVRNLASSPMMFFAVGLDRDVETLLHMRDHTHKLNIAVDVAHGDMEQAIDLIKWLSSHASVGKIMSGSICTAAAAIRNLNAGCTHLRVGVGPGAACTTRLMTGVGVPNFQAVNDIWNATLHRNRVIIADGGIRSPGDAAKYLAGGAHCIMLGRALSRTKESAGWTLIPHPQKNKLVKSFRGQASAKFQKDSTGLDTKAPEGISFPLMTWEGQVLADVIEYYEGGVRSAISYAGHTQLQNLDPELVEFVEVTTAGAIEGHPHKEV